MKIIVAIIIMLSLILSSIIVFAQELPEDPLVISVEFSGTTIPKLDYRFNRDKEYWELRGFGEWIPVTDIGEPGAPFNEQHIRLATNLIILDEEKGYQLFDDLSSGKLNLGSDSVLVLGLPPPANAQGEGIAPITPGVASAAISGGQSCISPRCQQIDQVWINIRGLMSGISPDAKNSVYDPVTKTWVSSTVEAPSQPPPSSTGVSGEDKEDVETVATVEETSKINVEKLVEIYRGYSSFIDTAANQFFLDKSLLVAIIKVESNGNPNAVSSKGAQGLMQLLPATAESVGVRDSLDPEQNIRGGASYLNKLKEDYDFDPSTESGLKSLVAAYNGGHNAIQPSEICRGQRKWECLWDDSAFTIPNTGYKETREYVKKVTAFKSIIDRNQLLQFYIITNIQNTQCRTESSACILRADALTALESAAALAADKNYRLIITSVFRTEEVQEQIYNFYQGRGVCAPRDGSYKHCPHVSGKAIDLYIDNFGLMPRQGSFRYDQNVQAHQELREIMVAAGWSPIESEWWHFEYRR